MTREPRSRLAVIGGFLGAGKTSCILRLAKKLISSGQRVGVVTNDQSSQLVDTEFLRASGLPVLEMPGGCFCCSLESFISGIKEMADGDLPDIILAEPIGSCIDLASRILEPLETEYGGQLSLAPLLVVADPRRVRRLLKIDTRLQLSDEINYLFDRQLQEADIILLNKVDMIGVDEAESLRQKLAIMYPLSEVISVSAKTGSGLEYPLSVIEGSRSPSRSGVDVDPSVHSEAEQSLSWFNGRYTLESEIPFDPNRCLQEYLSLAATNLEGAGADIAHVKAYVLTETGLAKAGITEVGQKPELNSAVEADSVRGVLAANARVYTSPDTLRRAMKKSLESLCSASALRCRDREEDCFRPSV